MGRRNPRSPSHNRYSSAVIEEGVIINVDKRTYTVDIETRHSAKTFNDIQWMTPYHHTNNGEGYHHIPEVGAIVLLCTPSDNTPPFIMGYIGAASAVNSEDGTQEHSSETGDEGSPSNASFRSGRPELNFGDIAITGRDDNFFILRRGGVLQIGSTQVAQRMYLPITNFIKDFCENYEMATLGGTFNWSVDRDEDDPGGDAPVRYTLHVHEHAQEAKATVRIRHFPINSGEGDDKTAYEINIAPQGIDTDTGEVTGEKYKLLVTMGGDKTEMIGGSHTWDITEDATWTVGGNLSITVSGSAELDGTGTVTIKSGQKVVVDAPQVAIGSAGAAEPFVKGTALLTALAAIQIPVATTPAGMIAQGPPTNLAAFQQALSTKVKGE